jgi:hypothetical protein
MKAKSIKGKTAEEIKEALEKNMADGFQPTLAVVFMANDDERIAVTELLSQKGIQIFGASTGDNFTDGEIESHTIVLLLLDIDPAYFQLAIKGADEGTIKEIAEQIGKSALRKFKKPCISCCIGRTGC